MLKKKLVILFFFLIFPTSVGASDIDNIIDNVVLRYAKRAFTASFTQSTTLKAMDMTDSASGFILFQNPNKMRWEYIYPEPQKIISNGKTLWIYVENDNQVMLGDASAFFRNGKGGSFLSDMNMLKENFYCSIEDITDAAYRVKMVPKTENQDIEHATITVSKTNSEILNIATYNAFGDENIVEFDNIEFITTIDNSRFEFTVPDNAEVLSIDAYLK